MRRKNSSIGMLATVAALVVALTCATGAARADYRERASLDADTLTVRNLIGEVEVRGHNGSSFEVNVHVQGKDGNPDTIRVEAKEGSHAELVVIFPLDRERDYVYPRMGPDSRTNFTFDGDGGSWLGKLLEGLSGRRITVQGSGRGMEAWADVEILVPAGKTLVVKHGVGGIDAEGVEGDVTLDSSSGPVAVRSIDGKLLVDTGSGAVTGRDLRGGAVIDTGSGRVEVSRFEGDELSIDTGSGSVAVEEITARRLEVDTGSGSVTASRIRADGANIDTGSGSISLELESMGRGDYNLDTGSGRITLALPYDASADVEASSGNGGIDVDLDDGVRMRHEERDEVAFSIGGGDASVRLDTGSGGIRIVRAR